jgi:hypothetical protein
MTTHQRIRGIDYDRIGLCRTFTDKSFTVCRLEGNKTHLHTHISPASLLIIREIKT